MSLFRKIRSIGRVTEDAPERPAPTDTDHVRDVAAGLRGSLQIRHVDAGSCNGCELEIVSTFGPVYDAERFGARLVASPRHADARASTSPTRATTSDAAAGGKLDQ